MIACEDVKPQASEHQQHDALVRDIQRYVGENLEADLSIESIGHQFHLSRRHLTRIFKAVTDETLLDFTNRIRVETAAKLVLNTQLSILDVSLAVGLHSPSYLTRLFHRHLGLSPSELRKSR